MDEQRRRNAVVQITEPLLDLRPSIQPVHARRFQVYPLPRILLRYRRTIPLPREHIHARHEPPQI